jgi:hypothetical protein
MIFELFRAKSWFLQALSLTAIFLTDFSWDVTGVPLGGGDGGSGEARTCQKPNKIKGSEGLPSPIASQNSDVPPDLRRVVDSWPVLSQPLKDAILAIVATVAR